MKKSIVLCSLLCLSAALFAQGPRGGGFGPMGGRGMGMFAGGPQPLVTGAPYSATEVVQTQETLADGNHISNQRQTNIFRDSQGRIRTEETVTPAASAGKQPYTVVTILDYVSGNRYVLDSSTMTAYQGPLHIPNATAGQGRGAGRRGGPGPMGRPPQGLAPQAQSWDTRQVAHNALAPQSVNGVLSTGRQDTETIAAGVIGNAQPIQVTRVTWMSNDLKVPVQIKSSDPRFGTTDMELTNIVQAEPSASLFVVPAGYTVKTGGRGMGGGLRPQMRGPRGPQPQ